MFIAIMLLFGSCKVGRYFWYNFSDITDHKIFPSRPLHGSAEPFRFIDSQNNAAIDGKVKIKFRTQFSNNKIVDLIKEIVIE